MSTTLRLVLTVALLATLPGCAAMPRGAAEPDGVRPATTPAPPPATLAPYFDTLTAMAPGDPARQQAELEARLSAAEATRSSSDTLRYAVALGSAGHAASNPVEAKRLIAELLAGPNTLDPLETALANACLREFDARVGLYAELARQREDAEQKLRSQDASSDKRVEALAAENRQLRRELAEAERKLEAVAEMERSLLEQADEEETVPSAPPPQR